MNEKLFYDANEISTLVGVSKSFSYKLIKQLNGELEKQGYFIIPGKVPKKFFNEKLYADLNRTAG